MKSKNYQLMLLTGALTVSFVAQAADVKNNSIVKDSNDTEETIKNTDANVYGHVVDAKTGEHMPYATIQIKGTTIATTTDKTGHYFLKNLPEGTFTVVVKCLGYKTVEKTVSIKHDATQELNFSLKTDDVALDEVVVSANRNETARRLAPNLVNVIGSKMFDITQSTCLAQGLNFQPGVRTEDDCQNCGFTQVRINGLDGHYSQILVDSRPVFSSLNGVYGLSRFLPIWSTVWRWFVVEAQHSLVLLPLAEPSISSPRNLYATRLPSDIPLCRRVGPTHSTM